MGDSIKDLLWGLVEKVKDADPDPESVSMVLFFACAMALLERRRDASKFEGGGGRSGGAGASGKWGALGLAIGLDKRDNLTGPADDRLLSMAEVAKILGVPESGAYELGRRGGLPVVRIGPKVRVRESALRAWINARETSGGLRQDQAGTLRPGLAGRDPTAKVENLSPHRRGPGRRKQSPGSSPDDSSGEP